MVFKLSNGESFDLKDTNRIARRIKPEHQGKYMRILIKKEYEDGTIQGDSDQGEELKNDKRVTFPANIINRKTNERQVIQMTYLLAENEDYIEYPSVDTYLDDGYVSSLDYHHKIEVVFKNENYTQRLFIEWEGNVPFYDMIANLEDQIKDGIENGDFKDQGFKQDENTDYMLIDMYNDTGELITIHTNTNELMDYVMSVRVIEFTETMKPDEDVFENRYNDDETTN